jgi:hypothetical protein
VRGVRRCSALCCVLTCPPRRGSSNHMYAALFSYVGKCGVLRRRVGGCLDGPCRDPAIMAYLVPEQG